MFGLSRNDDCPGYQFFSEYLAVAFPLRGGMRFGISPISIGFGLMLTSVVESFETDVSSGSSSSFGKGIYGQVAGRVPTGLVPIEVVLRMETIAIFLLGNQPVLSLTVGPVF